MKTEQGSDVKGQPAVTFTIDGIEYATDDRRQTAAELIALAGLDPADHDLAQVRGQGQVEHRYADTDDVQITPGARYISVFTGPTPVV